MDKMRKIMITGTDGFIGSNLKKELEDKFEIIEINENIFNNVDWKSEVLKYFWLDIKCVFHVGACSDTLETNVNYMMLLNYEFTKHISDLCKTKNIPLIYSSSAANYGTNNEYPSNLYGWSKYVAENYVTKCGGISLRYFNVYGPGEEHKGKMSSVSYQMYIKNKNNEEIKLFPKKPKRDFVYVKDVISANIFAYENYNKLDKRYYEVGNGVAEPFENILEYMNLEYSYHDESIIPKGYQFYTCSNSKMWLNGWKPKWSLNDGITDYLGYLN
jgi:ADP-L-glycero-D-manno-heptose 6-epimerase